MKLTMRLFGILMILVGTSFFLTPTSLLGWLETNADSTAIYFSAIIARLVLGALFIIAAPQSRFPTAIKILGYLFVLAAIIFIFIGQQSFQDLIRSVVSIFKPYTLISGVLVIAFGGFLIHAFSETKT